MSLCAKNIICVKHNNRLRNFVVLVVIHDHTSNGVLDLSPKHNSLYIDDHQTVDECKEFLEIIQLFQETVCVYIDRFEARKLHPQDVGLPREDIITSETLLDGMVKPIPDEVK